jgi:hypothetical protein
MGRKRLVSILVDSRRNAPVTKCVRSITKLASVRHGEMRIDVGGDARQTTTSLALCSAVAGGWVGAKLGRAKFDGLSPAG